MSYIKFVCVLCSILLSVEGFAQSPKSSRTTTKSVSHHAKLAPRTSKSVSSKVPQGYVNLGLPSGTLWKSRNERGLYDYRSASKKYGRMLPTIEQWQELIDHCKWTCEGRYRKVTGSNGKFIILPAAGCRDNGGAENDVGTNGYYWSSNSYNSKLAYYIYYDSGLFYVDIHDRNYEMSVRLVK